MRTRPLLPTESSLSMKRPTGKHRAFTILEALVVLAILVVLTMICVALVKHRLAI
jgi:prepilin-type N-terminal cleavage/methylation domain-containing protein